MATTVTLNGTSYSVPVVGEDNWGTNVTNYLVALSTGVLQKAGGSFTLTAEVDFGATYGVKSSYFKSRGTVSSTGVLRLANTELVAWRNAANSADLDLTVDASDVLNFNSNPVLTLALGTAEYPLKMNSGGTAYEFGQLVDAGISASAAITLSKLASVTASRLLVSDGSGVISASAVTSTEAGYLSGVTSAIQTQLDAKQPLDADLTALAALASTGILARTASDTYALRTIVDSGSSRISVTNGDGVSGNPTLDVSEANLNLASIGGSLDVTSQITGAVPVTNGGTGQTTATAGFDALSPTTTKGDLIASNGTNNVRVTVGADGLVLKADSTASEGVSWGTASSGSGEINYIDNSDAEANTTGWATYADAAGTTPVDGTGGSANITFSRQSSVILRGNQSFKITKDAANRQGEGVSYDFTIKAQDTSKKLKIQFDFKSDEDAAYTSGDLGIYIYDVTNATLITPVDTDLISGQNIFQTSFLSTSSTSYRLIFHVASTNASAYDVYIDNVIVGPGMTSQGAAIGAWKTPSTDIILSYGATAATNISSQTTYYRRVGENMEIQFNCDFNGAANADGDMTFSLPDGYTVGVVSDIFQPIGYCWGFFNSKLYGGTPRLAGGDNFHIIQDTDAGSASGEYYWEGSTTAGNNNPGNVAIASGDQLAVSVSIPISEWTGKGIVPMLAEDNLSEWQDYTPSNTQGFGTVTSVNLEYRRVGDSIEIRGDFTNGTVAASEAQLELPAGLTIGGTSSNANLAGTWGESGTTENNNTVLATSGDTYLNFSRFDGTLNGLTPQNGNAIFTSSTLVTFLIKAPIQEWSGSQNSLVGYSLATSTNAGLISAYEEGTWTPGESSKTNLTGTGSFNTAKYTRIGNMVFATIETITGYSVTTASNVAATADKTQIVLTTTGLPTISGRVYGSLALEAGSNYFVTGSVIGTTNPILQWDSASTGTVGIANIYFQYLTSD